MYSGSHTFQIASIPIFWPFTVNVSLGAGFSDGNAAVGRLRHLRVSRGAGTASNRESDGGPARKRHRRGLLHRANATNLAFSAYTNLFAGVGISVGFAGASIGLLGGVTANVTVVESECGRGQQDPLVGTPQAEFNSNNLFEISGDITAGLSLAV